MKKFKSEQVKIIDVRTLRLYYADLDKRIKSSKSDSDNPDNKYGFTIEQTYSIKEETNRVSFKTKIEITIKNDPTKVPAVAFQSGMIFEVPNLDNLIFHKGDQVGIDHSVFVFLSSTAISTARGVLVEKLAGTPLDKLYLPVIDPNRMKLASESEERIGKE